MIFAHELTFIPLLSHPNFTSLQFHKIIFQPFILTKARLNRKKTLCHVVKVQCVIGIKVETKKPLEDKKLLFNRLYVLMFSSQ